MDRSLKLPCLGQRHLSLDQVVQISIQPGIEHFLCEMGCPKPAMSSLKHSASKLTGEGSCTFRQYKHAQNKHHTICSGSQNKENQNCKLKKDFCALPSYKQQALGSKSTTVFYVVVHVLWFFCNEANENRIWSRHAPPKHVAPMSNFYLIPELVYIPYSGT